MALPMGAERMLETSACSNWTRCCPVACRARLLTTARPGSVCSQAWRTRAVTPEVIDPPTVAEVLEFQQQQEHQQQQEPSVSDITAEVSVVQQQLPQLLPERIGFLGAGQMGEALIRGFLAAGVCTPDSLVASSRNPERRASLSGLGVQTVGDAVFQEGAADVASQSDIIFIAVRPADLDIVLQALAPYVRPRHLIITIAAGVKLASIEARLPEATRVVRSMPNAPCMIRQGATAFVLGTHAVEKDAQKVIMLMSSVGLATPVDERMMDAVTALSGSGPAYVFLILEALTDGAVAAGLPREQALALATQTIIGSARWVFEAAGDGAITHPALLKDRVTSPVSCSMAGLVELETAGVRSALIQAVRASAKRSEELG